MMTKKTMLIVAAMLALGLMGLVANGPCGRQAADSGDEDALAEANAGAPDTPAARAPDPEGTVRFNIVYQNNVNGEFEPCG